MTNSQNPLKANQHTSLGWFLYKSSLVPSPRSPSSLFVLLLSAVTQASLQQTNVWTPVVQEQQPNLRANES